MEQIKFRKKDNNAIYTYYSGSGLFITLKDSEGRQHHMRIDELVNKFSVLECNDE